jgi:NADPH-dependent 7-cyano-7-deazaguanine reductase QueF
MNDEQFKKDLTLLGKSGVTEPTELLESFPRPGHISRVKMISNECSARCLHGDTLIDVATDETIYPFGRAIKDLVGFDGVVFSFDQNDNTAVAKKFTNVRKTGDQVGVVRVKYSLLQGRTKKGEPRKRVEKEITCTPDHLFLVKEGRASWHWYIWIQAKDLKPSMRLVSHQRQRDTIKGKGRHRLVAECVYGESISHEEHVHHKNHNHYDNTPSNLEILHEGVHSSYHRLEQYGYEAFLNIDDLVIQYENGASFADLGRKYECDVSTIINRIGHLVKKRTQRESLLGNADHVNKRKVYTECLGYYEKGYTIYELCDYYGVHSTSICDWVRKAGGKVRTDKETKSLRKKITLPSLNHKVISVESAGKADVYNMEVEDTECFFANGIIVHNCPITNQPDFYSVEIDYVPDERCIESKSLKLKLQSLRETGVFCERLSHDLLQHVVDSIHPNEVTVTVIQTPRGGVSIHATSTYRRESTRSSI